MSLVTLIPAYKPEFFDVVLAGLECQSKLPSKILISDDSADAAVISMTERWLKKSPASRIASRIECFVGPRQGAHANVASLLAHAHMAQADYFHVHFDDDVIEPSFYACHLEALARHPGMLSINKRRFIDADGNALAINQYPSFINQTRESLVLVSERTVYGTALPAMINWLGELTNCVFSVGARDVLENMRFGDGICYYGLGDLGAVLRLSEKNAFVFVNRTLSGFRLSHLHTSARKASPVFLASLWAWWALAIHAKRTQRITVEEYDECLRRFRRTVKKSVRSHSTTAMRKALGLLGRDAAAAENKFLATWETFLKTFPEGHFALCGQRMARGEKTFRQVATSVFTMMCRKWGFRWA